jgi:hypothetical protein
MKMKKIDLFHRKGSVKTKKSQRKNLWVLVKNISHLSVSEGLRKMMFTFVD